MRITLDKEQIRGGTGEGLEIAVKGFAGDWSSPPVQVYVEYYEGKLWVRIWDGSSEDAAVNYSIETLEQRAAKE